MDALGIDGVIIVEDEVETAGSDATSFTSAPVSASMRGGSGKRSAASTPSPNSSSPVPLPIAVTR